MSAKKPVANSLVLYKVRPARVVEVDDKIEIELEGGKSKRVRPKDVELLHPGPVQRLADLTPRGGEVEEAWELLAGGTTDVKELAELIFDDYTPATSWAVWELVAEGLYFEGTPWQIAAREPDKVAAERAAREAKVRAEREWSEFVARMESGELIEEDRKRLGEVEMLALGQREGSRILQALGHQESRENAHRLLVKVGYWGRFHNPYPGRLGLSLDEPTAALPELAQETRRDLTHLPAFAIDDEENRDPDDALSLDGQRLWVHVADVAALVVPDSEADLEARARGANLYLPERIVNMLPPAVTDRLGLGLQEVSPALSVGFALSGDGVPVDVEIVASWVRVQRLSYAEANGRLDESPLRSMWEMARHFRARRQEAGSATIQLPEVQVRVRDGRVEVRPLPRLDSRELVTEAMLMAGEAVARFALERQIPIPFATQPPPDKTGKPEDLAAMYAYRRQMRPSQLSTLPGPHAGLGLEFYTRTTSPLRRYSDLLVHQQLRAYLSGRPLLESGQLSERIAVAESGSAAVRRGERLSNTHWKLVYLIQNPQWQGRGVVVELTDGRGTLVIPDLAMETKVRLRAGVSLNDPKQLGVREVELPELTVWFRIRK